MRTAATIITRLAGCLLLVLCGVGIGLNHPGGVVGFEFVLGVHLVFSARVLWARS